MPFLECSSLVKTTDYERQFTENRTLFGQITKPDVSLSHNNKDSLES